MNIRPSSVVSSRRRARYSPSAGKYPKVRQHRLDDDAGQIARVLAQNPLRRLDVVVVQGDNVLDHAGWLARPLGDARRLFGVQRVERSVDANRDVLVVSVVPALDFRDLVSSGVGACGADGVQSPLGARVREPHLFDRWHPLAQCLCQPYLRLVRCAVAEAVCGLISRTASTTRSLE